MQRLGHALAPRTAMRAGVDKWGRLGIQHSAAAHVAGDCPTPKPPAPATRYNVLPIAHRASASVILDKEEAAQQSRQGGGSLPEAEGDPRSPGGVCHLSDALLEGPTLAVAVVHADGVHYVTRSRRVGQQPHGACTGAGAGQERSCWEGGLIPRLGRGAKSGAGGGSSAGQELGTPASPTSGARQLPRGGGAQVVPGRRREPVRRRV